MNDKKSNFKQTDYEIDLLDELKTNKKFAWKNSFKHFLKHFLIITLIEYVLAYLLGLNFGYKWGLVFVISGLCIYLFDTRKYYIELKSLLDVISHIRELKNSFNARGEIKRFINTYNMNIERAKLLLDLLKSFSPIPIIVFLSGLLLNAEFKKITSALNNLSNISNYKTIYLVAIIVLFIVYMTMIFKTWDRYKFLQFRVLQYQNAYDVLEEKAKLEKEAKEKTKNVNLK
ncbi:hypothetical protein GH866_22500 [Bacillus thuringiensis]|nr:hypothetical protein [Bacillus thuringiensis]